MFECTDIQDQKTDLNLKHYKINKAIMPTFKMDFQKHLCFSLLMHSTTLLIKTEFWNELFSFGPV